MILGATVLATSISKEIWTFAKGLHAYILAPKGIGNMNLKKYGPWAGMYYKGLFVLLHNDIYIRISYLIMKCINCSHFNVYTVVTGASEGIGKGYALEVSM